MLFNLYVRNIYNVDLEIESAVYIRNMSYEDSLPTVKVTAEGITLADEVLVQGIVVGAVLKRPARGQVKRGGESELTDTLSIFKTVPVVMGYDHSEWHARSCSA